MVYVDKLRYYDRQQTNLRYEWWCHLWADDLEELHQFAKRLGLRRGWFQDHSSLPHYDITANKRPQALQLGAVEYDLKRYLKQRGRGT